MSPEITTTETAEIWIREDGITQTISLPNIRETLSSAKEIMAAISRINHEKPVPVFVDMRRSQGIDREARDYYSGKDSLLVATALALLVESPLTRVIANFFIGFNQPAIPTRLFTSEDEATAWLKTFLA